MYIVHANCEFCFSKLPQESLGEIERAGVIPCQETENACKKDRWKVNNRENNKKLDEKKKRIISDRTATNLWGKDQDFGKKNDRNV